jgi:spore coat protein U-like protein
MLSFRRILLLCALLLGSPSLWAATATTTFAVTAGVVPTCSVAAAALNFGASIPNPIASNVDAQSTITATCSNGAGYTIALNAGTTPLGTVAMRRMEAGGSTVNYTMFTDAGRSTVWGDGTSGTSLLNGSGSGAAQVIPVYGRIPSGQTPGTGNYADTVTVTITF